MLQENARREDELERSKLDREEVKANREADLASHNHMRSMCMASLVVDLHNGSQSETVHSNLSIPYLLASFRHPKPIYFIRKYKFGEDFSSSQNCLECSQADQSRNSA